MKQNEEFKEQFTKQYKYNKKTDLKSKMRNHK